MMRINGWLRLASPFFWSAAVAWILQTFNVLVWWHPNCQIDMGIQEWPAQGFPLPYIQGSPVASVEWDYMPLVMAFDYAATIALVLPVTLALTRRGREGRSRWATAQAWTALVFFSLFAAWEASFLMQASHPVRNIAQDGESYFQYRPAWFWRFHDSGSGALFCLDLDRGPQRSAP